MFLATHGVIRNNSGASYPSSLKLFIDAGNPLSYSGSGTTVTDLIGTQNGTLVNGVGYSAVEGLGSFYFNGVNNYINFGINTAIQPTTARTVSLSFKYINSGIPYSDINFGTDRNGVILYPGTKQTEFANASTYQAINWGGTWTNGTWYYITIRWNGTSYSLLQNAVQISSGTLSFTPTNGVNPTLLGATWNGTSAFGFLNNSYIGQLKIYDESRTDQQTLDDWNLIKTRYGY